MDGSGTEAVDEPGTTPAAGERREYTYVADERTASRIGWALVRLIHTSSKAFVLMYVGAIVLILVKWLQADWPWVIAVIGGLAVWVSSLIWSMRKQGQAVAPAGRRLETSFGPTTMTIRSPIATSELQLSSITLLRQLDDMVAFQQENKKIYGVLPRELFPQEEVDRVRGLMLRQKG